MKFGKKILTAGLSIALLSGSYLNANALDSIDRIQGKDRYETAALIADQQKYEIAILVNSDNSLADGLSASGLAGAVGAPILLTKKNSIPDITLTRVEKTKKVYLIGGENSIDSNTESFLKEKGIEVKRISGEGRIETSYNVADEVKSITNDISKVIFTNAFKGEADAMSVASVAVRDKAPIILTDGKNVSYNTTGLKSYAIGGTATMSNELVNNTNSKRIGGADRFDTNKKIIQEFYGNVSEFYISKAYNLVDALTGSTLAKETPIVLVEKGSDKSIIKEATKITALGGIDSKIIKEIIDPIPQELDAIIGNWYSEVFEDDDIEFNWLYLRENTINNVPFEVVDRLETAKGKGIEIIVHDQAQGDYRIALINSWGTLMQYSYDEYRDKFIYESEYENIGEPIENDFGNPPTDTNNKIGWVAKDGRWRYYDKNGNEVENEDLALKKANKVASQWEEKMILSSQDVNKKVMLPYLKDYYIIALVGEYESQADYALVINKNNFYSFYVHPNGEITKIEKYSEPNF